MQYFRSSLSYQLSLRSLFRLFQWSFYKGLTISFLGNIVELDRVLCFVTGYVQGVLLCLECVLHDLDHYPHRGGHREIYCHNPSTKSEIS